MTDVSLSGLQWGKDEHGSYWYAIAHRHGKQIGVTGNYYCVDESSQRPSRAAQEEELRDVYNFYN